MAKKTKGLQISEQLHKALRLKKLDLGYRRRSPDVTFQEVLEDLLNTSDSYLDILNKLVADHPETKAWIKRIAKELNCYEYVEGIVS